VTSPPPSAASRRRRLVVVVLAVAVIAATFFYVLPRIADYSAVWAVVRELSWWQVALLAAVTALNLVTFAPPWMVALPGLDFPRAFELTQASTASTYIAPGGAAVGVAFSFATLRRWGFPPNQVALASAVTGIWNQFALLGFPVIALGLLALQDETDPLLQSVAVIGLVVFVVAALTFVAGLSTPKIARSVGTLVARVANGVLRLVRRGSVRWSADSFVRFRDDAIALLGRRWHLLTVTTLAGQLSVFLVLLVSLRVLHVSASEVNGSEAFAAWSLARLLGSLPLTPGGLGVVEVGLTTALVGFGGHNAEVVAAVLLYRFLTIVPTLVLGLLAATRLRTSTVTA
jgi:putative heme transporter